MSEQRGFTIIELIVAISVIGAIVVIGTLIHAILKAMP